jgi:phage terminase large subunit-like protein
MSEAERLEYDWTYWGRPAQFAPPGGWLTWLVLAGRGFGKTRTGAEFIRAKMCGATPLAGGRWRHVAIIAETAADARDVMVGKGKSGTGASGLLQAHATDYRPVYVTSARQLRWPNGAIGSIYNATEPDQLRGPQFDGAWCDELAKWRYASDTWDMLQMGLRTGEHPQVVITTTPRPIKLIKDLVRDPTTAITRGSTWDNALNLAPTFVHRIVSKYAGTRLGRQELEAEILEDIEGALWRRSQVEDLRVARAGVPDLKRLVIAVDPSVSTNEGSNETGIVAIGLGYNNHAYVLDDRSGVYTPDEWGRTVVALYNNDGDRLPRKADRVIGERNNGGDMVEATMRTFDRNISYQSVWASKGKFMRAEPVSALYEQGRVHHVGAFPKLEDQMCEFTADFDRARSGYSPDRLDALVWGLTKLLVDYVVPDMSFAVPPAITGRLRDVPGATVGPAPSWSGRHEREGGAP